MNEPVHSGFALNQHSNLSGICFVLAGVFVLTVMDVLAKILVEASYSPFQILAIRGWLITLSFLGWKAVRGELGHLKTRRPHHHAVRAGIGFLAPFCFFTALGTMPLADTIVVAFAAPFLMTALSVFLLKETVGLYRWGAIAVGFAGVVLVVQPGGDSFEVGAFYALGACISYSLIQTMTRWMGKTETPVQIVFYFNAGTLVIGTCALPFIWQDMAWGHVLILIAFAATAMLGHILMTTGFTRAPIGVVAPFEYSALVWSTALGFLVWGDFPASHVWTGAGIIVASGIYMIHRERKKKAPSSEVGSAM